MAENTMVGFFMVGILMARSMGKSRKDTISLAFNAGKAR